jgi:hypothetical protein
MIDDSPCESHSIDATLALRLCQVAAATRRCGWPADAAPVA